MPFFFLNYIFTKLECKNLMGICGDFIKQKDISKNFLIRVGDFVHGKFHVDYSCYYHAKSLAIKLKRKTPVKNLF